MRGLQAVLCILAVLVIIQGCSAAPPSFAQIDLSETQEYRNMSVSVLETIDLMDPAASRVTLHSTTGTDSDRKVIPLPSIRNVRRIFSSDTASWQGNTLTILVGNDTTVSLTSMTKYEVFIRPYLPRVRVQVPDATADVLLVKVNASMRHGDLPTLIRSTERAYLMHDPRGILAIQQNPLVIGGYGVWSNLDYNESDFGFTFTHNAFLVTDWTLDPTYARWVSGLTPNITGNPPTPGDYLLSVFQYDPGTERLVSYAAWPVSIMDGDNAVILNRTVPWRYDLKSGDALLLTFENTTQITNLSYVIIRENSTGGLPDTYDAEVRVNMSALEELGSGLALDFILAENPLMAILKAPGISQANLTKVVSYTITSTTNTTPPASSHPAQINITPGYGISGYATQSTSVVVPRTDLQGLLPGTFRVYGLGAGQQNEVTALDAGLLMVGYAPTANFTPNVTSGAVPLAVQFTDNSTGTLPLSYAWDFGDGGTSTLPDPVHLFSSAGNYTVNLTVTNDFGSDSTEVPISVTVPPLTADFDASPLSGPAPLTVHFYDRSTGPPDDWSWVFGDGGTSDLPDPVHTYLTPGTYTVTLTVGRGAETASRTRTDYITVTAPVIQADFTASPTSGFAPLFVQFEDTSTGIVTSWAWDFTNDGTTDSTAQNPGHTYPSVGVYSVRLTVTGPGGSHTRIRTNYITVNPLPPAPVAQFTANVTSGEAPLAVRFWDNSTGSRHQWTWDFGDGGTSDEQNPEHLYLNPGNYTVALTVRGIGGTDTEVKPDYIQVLYPPPVAIFTANVTSGEAPLAVQFIDLSEGNPVSWSWDFGDNTTSSFRDPVHVYPDPGTYTVTLTVTNPRGSDTWVRTGYITVTVPEPVLRADFSGTPLAGYEPLTVNFTDASTGDPASWSWLFGDGGTSALQDPVHTYNLAGVYSVSLTVTNATANDTLTRDAYVTVYRRGSGGGSGGGGGGGTFVIGTTATPTPTPAIPVGPPKEVAVLLPGVEGQSLEGLNVTPLPDEDLPPLPVGPVYMGYAWLISPEDAVIEPFARLSVTFTAEQWLELVGKDLVMMWYDPVSGTWQPLATTIDDAGMSVSGRVIRGGIVALMSNGRTTTPTMSPTITPSPSIGPETPAGEGLGPWIWIIPVVVIIAGCALAAVYIMRVRTGPGKPPS
ncbi:MAG: PKD domain-containing protein [Methanoregulaceae archaeon]